MKKLLVITMLLLPLVGWGQTYSLLRQGGAIVKFGSGVTATVLPDPDTSFSHLMSESYLSINDHFSTYYKSEIRDYLNIVLRKSYVMPDGSDNYYTVYGENGQDKQVADWFHYVRFYDTTFQSTLSVPKTGDVMKWQLEDSLYTQNDIPNHKITNSGKGLLTSTDGFTGINGTVYMGATTFTGEYPNIDWSFNRLFVNANAYFGTFPNLQRATAQRITISLNYFTGFEGASGFVNSNFQQLIATDNEFTEEALETLFADFHDYWVTQANAPTQAVTINVSGGATATPNTTTQGYITAIEAVFDASAFTITIITN